MNNEPGKICKKTLRASVIASTVVLMIGVSFILLVAYFGESIRVVTGIGESRRIIAAYNMLDSNNSYGKVLQTLIKIESSAYKNRKRLGIRYSGWRSRPTKTNLETIASLASIYQTTKNFDPLLLFAIGSAETLHDKKVKSHAGARGYFQLMPRTFNYVNQKLLKYGKIDIWDVYHNTEASIYYLLDCQRNFKNKFKKNPTIKQLAESYNAGYERIARAYSYKKPAYYLPAETRHYGRKVEYFYCEYKKGNYNVVYTKKKDNEICKKNKLVK